MDLEFESQDITLDVILKCLRYSSKLAEDFKKPVYIFIVSLKEERNHIIRFKTNLLNQFYIFVISLTAKDQNKTLNTLKSKIKNKEKLIGTDIVALKLLPIIDIKHKRKVLVECIWLLNEIENLSTEKLNEILNIYLNYFQTWYGKDEFLRFFGDYMDFGNLSPGVVEVIQQYCYEKWHGEGIEEGRVKGMSELKSSIKKMISEGCTLEDIEKIVNE